MASKRKGTSRKKQFFSELDALIADAESVSLDAKSSTLNSSSMNNQFISELDTLMEDQKPGSAETEVIVDSSTSTCVASASKPSRGGSATVNELPPAFDEGVKVEAVASLMATSEPDSSVANISFS